MSRIRSIKPEFFFDEELADLSAMHRLLFIGLWTQADREGRMEDRPRRIKAAVFPYEDADIEQMLSDLARGNFIIRYEAGGESYIAVRTFGEHQRPHTREAESIIPPPPLDAQATNQGEAENQTESQGDGEAQPRQCLSIAKDCGKGREGKGRDQDHTSNSADAEPDLTAPDEPPDLALIPPEPDPLGRFGPDDLLAMWNEQAHPAMPRAQKLTGSRRRKIETRLRENPEPEFWEDVIEAAGASPHCRGESRPAPGANKPWRCTLDFIVDNDTNALKILEGAYGDDREAGPEPAAEFGRAPMRYFS